MKRKILIVITTGFTKYGGLTSVVMNSMRQMDMAKFKISIVSGNVPEDDLLDECKNMGIEYIKISGRSSNPLMYIHKLRKILKTYDVVHIHSNSATAAIELLAAKMAGVEIRIVQNHTAKCNHKIVHFFLKPIFDRLYTYGIACSQKAGDWIFGLNNYQILNNGIDTQKYKFNEENRIHIRQQYGIDDNCICIGHVGKIYQPKNHKFLLEIFNDYNDVINNSKLLLVGDGVMRQEIEEYAKELGIYDKVIFAGMKSNVNEYLSAFDIFVFPSIWEGMPLAVVEAQASGLPCFISDSIDKDILMTPMAKMLSLDKGSKYWADKLPQIIENERKIISNKCILELKSCNYDSKVCARILDELYS